MVLNQIIVLLLDLHLAQYFSVFTEVKKSIILSIVFGFLHFFRNSVCFLAVPAFPKELVRNATSDFSRRQACRVKAIHIEGKKCG